ncbi:MAG: LPXTG cell wall anchor domain-containing protein [Clostridiales bacterium]|jgi:LPXTG-motif cell wall-anchored protein|nr:LPXTG cell wall anchor domain-containing protein [Clostridiales bacterium]
MKLRKLMMLVVALVCVLAFSAPAYAAVVELPAVPTVKNNDTQAGWASNGTDNMTTDLTIEQLTSAKYLILELGAAPMGGMQFIWQGDGDGWAWNQTDGVIPDEGTGETTIVIDLAATAKNYSAFQSSTQAKIFLGYYSNTVADLQITRAYLSDSLPGEEAPADEAAPAADGGEANPATGDSSFIFIVIAALAMACAGAVVFYRKAKAQ